MLGKRCASEMEACLTEYYRQECLRALYAKQERPRDCAWVSKDMMAKAPRRARKGVSFAMAPEIIGSADPLWTEAQLTCPDLQARAHRAALTAHVPRSGLNEPRHKYNQPTCTGQPDYIRSTHQTTDDTQASARTAPLRTGHSQPLPLLMLGWT
ncbi:hypothetical protein GQ600_24498 [Phytophthora cactorum]|nr:hypothetical protein GQ600_24498 [Phytophthora cactorum]